MQHKKRNRKSEHTAAMMIHSRALKLVPDVPILTSFSGTVAISVIA